ncbi:hypothetical protein BASA81_004899 [Batrachochytrium salamandrivorans]|nr:hypothetical protein BASA81_004899 [Batrachochytrium salamandrivorans]
MSTSSEDENEDCPICVEPFDGDDRQFQACDCLYRVCMFCVRRLMTEFEGKCPGCRKQYNEANFKMRELSQEQVEKRRLKLEKQRLQERNARKQQQQPTQQFPTLGSSHLRNSNLRGSYSVGNAQTNSSAFSSAMGTTGAGALAKKNGEEHENLLAQQRKPLSNVKVLQPNAVFVMGLAQSIAREDILKRNEYFGQFGQIIKIVIGHLAPTSNRTVTLSAHITYVRAEDAQLAMQTLGGTMVEGHYLRLSSGTTRYCHSFLRGQHCNTVDCTYLHHEVASNTSSTTTAGSSSSATAFGGTDPFDMSSPSPSPTPPPTALLHQTSGTRSHAVAVDSLGGVEYSLYQRQRNRVPAALTLTRAIGEGAKQGGETVARSFSSSPNPLPTFDATLGHLADLILARTLMSEDLKRHFGFAFPVRPNAIEFVGLDSIFRLDSNGGKPRAPTFVSLPQPPQPRPDH